MDCIYCQNNLPERAYFCPSCASQCKCKFCAELLVKDAKVCVFCGEEVSMAKKIQGLNTIEFTETEDGRRTFKATFSDSVGQSIIDSLGLIMSNKITGRTLNIEIPAQDEETIEETIITHQPAATVEDEANLLRTIELSKLEQIISLDTDKPILIEPRLKAKSKREFGQRLTILFVYYKSLLDGSGVQRKALTALLDGAGVEDGNIRSWLTKNPLISISGDSVIINPPGIDAAKRFLAEVFDNEVPDVWQLHIVSKIVRKPIKSKVEDHPSEVEAPIPAESIFAPSEIEEEVSTPIYISSAVS